MNVEANLRRSLGLCDMSRQFHRDKENISSCLEQWWSGDDRLEASRGSLLGGTFEHCVVVTVATILQIY